MAKLLLPFVTCCLPLLAQQPGPALSVDAAANRRPISPDIYGINFYWDASDAVAAASVRATARRWGGNSTSTYHWKFDLNSLAADWFFEVLPEKGVDAAKLPEGGSFNQFVDQARVTGGTIYSTIPVLGWLPKARQEMCSFDIARYGKQCKQDPFAEYHPIACGNGIQYVPSCGEPSVLDGKGPSNPTYVKNDPNDAYAQFDETLQEDWIRYLITRYGKGNQGGVSIWSLGNEPIWWDSTHRDVHPDPYTYDELIRVNIQYAEAIKRADPSALVAGPVGDNWASLWMSKKDIVAGWNAGNWFANPIDRKAHGDVPLLAWYLQQMKQYELSHGTRLLDILDVHAYIHPSALEKEPDSNAIRALRLESTREMWDSTYVVSNDYWIKDPNTGGPVTPRYIPLLREIIDQNYPGTKLAITEYNWTALDTLNGGLAQADLLGIFGREGVDYATLFAPGLKPALPAALAFKMYRNHDGIGGTFGETSVGSVSADQGKLAIYGALRSDLHLTAMVINKTNNDLASNLSLANFPAGAAAKAWRLSAANLDAIVQQPDAPVADGAIATVFPANSITLLVVPPATYPVPKPQVAAVTNVASYGAAIAPGQMVAIFGAGMGPGKLATLRQDDNGLVSTSVEGVRILFDGVPAPIVYVSDKQCAAVVPYFGAISPATHIQVEYQGVRSEPVELPLVATGPGLFSRDASGKGQGSITNRDSSVNSPENPAAVGSVVTLWATGEGLTDPPGVDGRLAIEVLPKPLAPVSVEIGGLAATVQYAGAAPYAMPGLFQINARIPAAVTPGSAVPVRVKIGDRWSQDGVTLAVSR